MNSLRLTGPEAGVLKYDLLTALSVAGLNGSSTLQMSILRLVAVVTARYNWRADEFVVGQRDLARMWSVNERTVKREVKRLTESGLLICKRPGVRGRVGAYRLNQARIAEMSKPCWPLVGPDFEARMGERYTRVEVNVVPLRPVLESNPANPVSAMPGTWEKAMARLASDEPNQFNAWFAKLGFCSFVGGTLTLSCESTFAQRYIDAHLTHVLLRVVEDEMGPVARIVFQ